MESNSERDRQQRVHERDAEVDSPEIRAQRILTELHEKYNEWDLLCFAVLYIGYMSTVYPWLETAAKAANRLLYTAHYLDDDTRREVDKIEKRNDGHNEQSSLVVERSNDTGISLHVSDNNKK